MNYLIFLPLFILLGFLIVKRSKFIKYTTSAALLHTYLVITGFVLIAIAGVNIPDANLKPILVILGVIGGLLIFAFEPDAVGLSNSQQALLSTISMILIVVGGISLPSGLPWYYSVIISLLGAVGIGIKEALGSLPPTTTKA
jgi:peptidoglycan/LPS O-acetylase OafA/YrhL